MAVDKQNNVDEQHLGPTSLLDILIVSKLLAEVHSSIDVDVLKDELPWENTPALGKLGFNAENITQTIEEISDEVESFISALS